MKKFLFLSVFLFVVLCSFNLIASERPLWVKEGFFVDLEKSYLEVVYYSGYDLNMTRDKAMLQIIKRRSLATGGESRISAENGIISVYNGHNLISKSRILDEYVEKREGSYPYTVYLLVHTAKNPAYEVVEKINISLGVYPFSARVFVPGMAQIYKGQNLKGALFIGGEALFIGGIITLFSLKSYYEHLGTTHTQQRKNSDIANGCNIAGYVSVGLAVTLYLWNIIDGAVAKGEPYIEADGRKVALMPVAAPGSIGLAMNLRF